MPLLCRATEVLEGAFRLIAARGSRIVALENFHRAHGGAEEAGSTGVFEQDFAEAKPGLVSVVILTLNGAEMLRSLFGSLEEHNSWPDLEIIVVDHGGDEATRALLEELSSRFDIRHLVPGRNFSFAFSCNRAAQVARGDIVLFLNNDIEFTEDIVPRMVAGVQSTDGLVGVKLWQKSPEGKLASLPQIGIRFRWNLHQGWTVPYEAKPGPADARRALRPAIMPGVTAAIVACSRDRFLALGGFPEDYLYAYEDVDFDLKARMGGMMSISLNDVSATHIVGATRFKRARRARRRRWHRYNLSVFRARCGYLCRRLAWMGLFGDRDGFDWGRRPTVALIPPSDGKPPVLRTDAFAFVDVKKVGILGADLYGYDLVVSCDPAFDFSRARHLSPMAVRVGLARQPEAWSAAADRYDLVFAEDEAVASEVSAQTGMPVEVLRPGDIDLVPSILGYLRKRHRLVILGDEKDERYSLLARRLRSLGMSVRFERLAEYPTSAAIRDDFAIWLSAVIPATLPPDTCHIVACDIPEDAPWRGDIYLGGWKDRFESWFELLVREMEGYHSFRMSGPVDAPLENAKMSDASEAAAFWARFRDPTEWLIGLA